MPSDDERDEHVLHGGTCIFFHENRGWGFIRPNDSAQKDMFVHKSDIRAEDVDVRLEPYQMCTYRIGKGDQDRPKAVECTPGKKILDRMSEIEGTLGLKF
jgi:cold shock CspA family protein